MAVTIGQQLGSYEITALLGKGGMGEVYRARDTKLKRDVAIKVLPEALAAEPERVSRFEREAELLASLNHANIAIVHDFRQAEERHLLVMEFVDGETLADRIKRGPLPIEDAVHITRQITEALEAAHQKGIIHRDLKPANIKVDQDGKVKVLDFGLAKFFESGATPFDASNSPTLMSGTLGGVILGTAAYMSPEQARGKSVDKRTDIWALGCVLYEMLTGTQAFAGENLSDTIAVVIRGEPDLSALPHGTPYRVRLLIERCLRKDPRQRLHDAADARIELDDGGLAPAVAQTPRHNFALIVLALTAGIALTSVALWIRERSQRETPMPLHLSIEAAPGANSILARCCDDKLYISPDGQWIVYPVTRDEKYQLFVRGIGQSEGKLINGTDDARNPFFSPDSKWLAFGSGSQLKKIPLSGGSPIVLCNMNVSGAGTFMGGAWDADDTLFFVPEFNGGVWSISASGGTPQLLLNTDVEKDRIAYSWLQNLPGKKGVLFTVSSGRAITADDDDIAVLELGATEPRILIRGGSHGRYLRTGHLVYGRAGALLAVPFDVSRLVLTGTPISVVDNIQKGPLGYPAYAVSENGVLVFEPNSGIQYGGRLGVADRRGNVQPINEVRSFMADFSISPNGRYVATRVSAVNDDIWTYEIANGTALRLTFEPLDEISPQWTADGTRVAFGTRTGKMFWKSADGTGQREELSHGEYPRYPSSFSPDGKILAFVENHPSRQRDIWFLSLDGDRKPQPFLTTDSDEWAPKFSPDGRWIAYVSNETSRDEIYIRPVGSAGGRKRVSGEGGTSPAWNRNGRELFFIKGNKLASVALDPQLNPVGRERIILDTPKLDDLQFQADATFYDVLPDGEHFVMMFNPQFPSPTHYNVVLNWFTELQQRVPVK